MRARMIVLLSLVIGAPRVAAADDLVEPELLDGWRMQFEPYGFIPVQTTGDLTVRGMNVPIDVNIGDVVDKLQFAGQGRFEAWKRWMGFVFDGTYIQTGSSRSTPGGEMISTSARTFIGDFLFGVRALTWRGTATNPTFAVEVLGGVRVDHLDARASVGDLMMDQSDWRVNGVIAVETPLRINEKWAFVARGALGVRGPYWTVLGGMEYDLSKEWLVNLSYRADWIRIGGSPSLDITQHGPFIGLGFRFGAGPIY